MLNRANLDIAKLAATEDSRYTLTGILVTPHETVETDGRQLIRVSTPGHKAADYPAMAGETLDTWEPFVLPRQAALDAAKAIPRDRGSKSIPILQNVAVGAETAVNGTATLIATDLERVNRIEAKKMDGQFPDWERVIPDKAKAEYIVAFDAKILANVFRAAADFDKANDGGKGVIPSIVTLRFSDPEEAVRIDIANGDQEFTGVVMPCSNDDAKAFVETRKRAKEQAEADADCLAVLRRDADARADAHIAAVNRHAEAAPSSELPSYQMIDTDREERAERETPPEPEPVTPEPTPEPSVSALDAWLAS